MNYRIRLVYGNFSFAGETMWAEDKKQEINLEWPKGKYFNSQDNYLTAFVLCGCVSPRKHYVLLFIVHAFYIMQ